MKHSDWHKTRAWTNVVAAKHALSQIDLTPAEIDRAEFLAVMEKLTKWESALSTDVLLALESEA